MVSSVALETLKDGGIMSRQFKDIFLTRLWLTSAFQSNLVDSRNMHSTHTMLIPYSVDQTLNSC
jgi:hypothetical protein